MSHAVIVHLKLSDLHMGTEAEREQFFELEQQLMDALGEDGEFDGNEFGGGECVFYMYGEDADLVFRKVASVLRSSPLARGGFALMRYGDVLDGDAPEVREAL